MNNLKLELKKYLSENVKRGAALLDKLVPNWKEEIKSKYNQDISFEFNMRFPYQCVLGHLWGSYINGLKFIQNNYINKYELKQQFPSDYGFTVAKNHTYSYGNYLVFKILTELWEEEWKI